MKRNDYIAARSYARQRNSGFELEHNGRVYWVSRAGCDRMSSRYGLIDRVPTALAAMTLNQAGDSRRRLNLKAACRVLVGMAREYRLTL